MISTGIDKRVKVHQIIENQLPEFVLSESPKTVDFLKQYYRSSSIPRIQWYHWITGFIFKI